MTVGYSSWSPELHAAVVAAVENMPGGFHAQEWGFTAVWLDKSLAKSWDQVSVQKDRWIRGLLLWTNALTFSRGSLGLIYGMHFLSLAIGSLLFVL